ncbi:MAG: hypothetical protein H6661_06655 [Ardenticatenaceae bacterium]|nr:hypothetical protein [Ardenticatenaceae bacterium]
MQTLLAVDLAVPASSFISSTSTPSTLLSWDCLCSFNGASDPKSPAADKLLVVRVLILLQRIETTDNPVASDRLDCKSPTHPKPPHRRNQALPLPENGR